MGATATYYGQQQPNGLLASNGAGGGTTDTLGQSERRDTDSLHGEVVGEGAVELLRRPAGVRRTSRRRAKEAVGPEKAVRTPKRGSARKPCDPQVSLFVRICGLWYYVKSQ